MTENQIVGLFVLLGGIYFLVCSIWGRNFFLYKLKAQRVAGIFGEPNAHAFYTILGVVLLGAGIAMVAGMFG